MITGHDRPGASITDMAQLEAAYQAYQAAREELPVAQAEARAIVQRARDLIEQRRLELAAEMVAAAQEGVRQVDIMRITGYSREQVRSILRAGGIEP